MTAELERYLASQGIPYAGALAALVAAILRHIEEEGK